MNAEKLLKEYANLRAWLLTIRRSESGREPSDGDYWRLVGGGKFWNNEDHPRIMVHIHQFVDARGKYHWLSDRDAAPVGMVPTGKEIDSTAAGAPQFLARTWDGLVAKHPDLIDFSPAMQDRALVYLLDDLRAIEPICAGDVDQAIARCNRTWASFPGVGYENQHMNSAEDIAAWFEKYGGTKS